LAELVRPARKAVGQLGRNSAPGGQPNFRMARLHHRKVPQIVPCSCRVAWTHLPYGARSWSRITILRGHERNNDCPESFTGDGCCDQRYALWWGLMLTAAERVSLVVWWPKL